MVAEAWQELERVSGGPDSDTPMGITKARAGRHVAFVGDVTVEDRLPVEAARAVATRIRTQGQPVAPPPAQEQPAALTQDGATTVPQETIAEESRSDPSAVDPEQARQERIEQLEAELLALRGQPSDA